MQHGHRVLLCTEETRMPVARNEECDQREPLRRRDHFASLVVASPDISDA